MITGNGSEVTDPPQIYPSLETDLVIGSLHLIAGVLAVLGNGVVFFAYFKDASQRASACMFVEVLIFRDRFCFEIYIYIYYKICYIDSVKHTNAIICRKNLYI